MTSISSVSSSSYQVQTATATVKNSQSGFELYPDQSTDPAALSFEDYKRLTSQELKVMFRNDKEVLNEAMSLKNTVSWTENDTLNKIFFETKLNDLKNGTDDFAMLFLASALAGTPDVKNSIENLDPDNLALTSAQKEDPFWKKILENKDGIKSEQEEPSINIKDSKELVEYFTNIKSFFDVHIKDGWSGAFDENKMFQVVENTLALYDTRSSQNSSKLESYSNNQSAKTAINEAQNTEQADKKDSVDDTKEESKEDYIKTLRKLVEDIKWIMRTGFTKEELEHLEKLIAKLQQMMEDGADESEISSKIKEIKQAILKLQKRVNGEAIIEIGKNDPMKPTTSENSETDIGSMGFKSELDVIKISLEKMKSGAIKDKEQFDLAMAGHGLDPKNDMDIFTFTLIQRGYGIDEARES
jgi:hypothetical protein